MRKYLHNIRVKKIVRRDVCQLNCQHIMAVCKQFYIITGGSNIMYTDVNL